MILCCGEALIDMIPEPLAMSSASGADGFVPHSGGAIFNTAIALGRLNAPVAMMTGLSNDLFGQQLYDDLAKSKVDTSYFVRQDRPTTLAFVQLTDGHASYQFYDENTAGRMLTVEDMPAVPDEVKALYFGGISLASEPCGDAYAGFLEQAPEDCLIMIDPNIRPSFIGDEDRYRARLAKMMSLATIVKTSDEDLLWLSGQSVSLDQAIKDLLAAGPSVVILTEGSKGATAYLQNGTQVRVAANKVDVVDTVGAGDTFNAGVLCMLSRLDHLSRAALNTAGTDVIEEALRFGAKVAAVTVSRAGANPPWAQEL
ncbi:MAG: carbohydrate kinase [Pseudomonadota bacterium]|nr:carbohydrate kinase [Pseudomonadota bacterium]